jgi:Bacterial dnaA protein helix-turn-helix
MFMENNKIQLDLTDDSSYRAQLIKFIKEIVADYQGRPMSDYERNSRKTEVIKVKHTAVYFIMKCVPKVTLAECGSHFAGAKGNTYDHATVLHCVKKFTDHLTWDKALRSEFKELEMIIKNKVGSTTLDLDNDYYYFDMNNFCSAKHSDSRVIMVTGFSPEEMENMVIMDRRAIKNFEVQASWFGNNKVPFKQHENTGMYILERLNKDEDEESNN